MEAIAELQEGLQASQRQLYDNGGVIDLDALAARLAAASDALGLLDKARIERDLLHRDLQQRIGGMIKAMAAADRTGDRLDEGVALAEGLSTLAAEELIATYRRVSARFRDQFKSSFAPALPAQQPQRRSI